MSDHAELVKELRAPDGSVTPYKSLAQLCAEAADLIEAQAAQLAEVKAERELLQEVLDGRPAINAALPDSYIRWSRAVMSGDVVRAAIQPGDSHER